MMIEILDKNLERPANRPYALYEGRNMLALALYSYYVPQLDRYMGFHQRCRLCL